MMVSTTLGSESYSFVSTKSSIERKGESYSRSITELVLLARKNLSQDSAHNLTTSGFRQVGDDEDRLWCRKWTNALPDLENEVLLQLVIDLVSVLDGHECIDGLPGQFIIDTDDCGFCDRVVLNQGCFDFGGRETVTGDVDNIVDSAPDPIVPFMVTSSPITSELRRSVIS